MRSLLCSMLALGGCSSILGIDDFEVPPPGIEGRLGVRLTDNRPQTETDIRLLDGVRVDWESDVGESLSQGSVVDGYYNIPMDELSVNELENGSLHFQVLAQTLDVYVDLRRRVEFGQTIDVVIPNGSLLPSDLVIAVLARDQFGNPASDVSVRLEDGTGNALSIQALYLDDEQLPAPIRETTGGSGLVWFFGNLVTAGRSYQAVGQVGQTRFSSRIITLAEGSFHFLAAEEE
jgi:hypothetical protein